MNKYPKRADAWNDQDTALAAKLIAAGSDNATFLNVLGRSKRSARERLRYIKARKPHSERSMRSSPNIHCRDYSKRVDVPDAVIQAAVLRQLAPRSITALFFGDPPTGYSALDRRATGAAA